MNYSVTIPDSLNQILLSHLIRADGQEDLCFALYNPVTGQERKAGIITEIILPEIGDRNVHGNVSFNSAYFDKVVDFAMQKEEGICFIHSHPGAGWQNMSSDDVKAEEMLSSRVKAVSGLPLLGMTAGSDGTWSARFWEKAAPKVYERRWCESVKVIGHQFNIDYADIVCSSPTFGEELARSISAWTTYKQDIFSRLKVGVVGLGSVGSIVAEALIRTGVQELILIDFDIVEKKNLDRLAGASHEDIGRLKVDVTKERLEKAKILSNQMIRSVPYSIVEEEGLNAAIDCDILFSCVDRPWPRFILNCLAYGMGIPVIDGGIDASPNKRMDNLGQARWRTHTIAFGKRCLCCLGQYTPEAVSLEQTGLLEDQHYISDLPEDHFVNRGENVFGFSLALAGIEMQQFLSYILHPYGVTQGPKEYDFTTGNIDWDFKEVCDAGCVETKPGNVLLMGDKLKTILIAEHPIAKSTRDKAIKLKQNASEALDRSSAKPGILQRIISLFKW